MYNACVRQLRFKTCQAGLYIEPYFKSSQIGQPIPYLKKRDYSDGMDYLALRDNQFCLLEE